MPRFLRLASLLATAVPLLLMVVPVAGPVSGWRLMVGIDREADEQVDSAQADPWFWVLMLSAAGSALAQALRRLAIAASLHFFTVWMFLLLMEAYGTPTPWFWGAFAGSILGAVLAGLEIRRVLETPNVTLG